MMRTLTLLSLAVLGLAGQTQSANAQTRLDYSLSFSGYLHHEAVVALTVHNAPAGPLTFRMSRSSTGRYATHEFGKNIYFVSARDASGKPLEVKQVDGDVYEVPNHDQELTLQYTLFGDRVDGTYVGIDRTHAHLNMPGTMIWLVGQDQSPIKITFHVPDSLGWKVATQLVPTQDPYTFTAPGLQYLMDCPTELSAFRLASFPETNPDGKVLTFRVSLHAEITDDMWSGLVSNIKKLVEEERKVFGEFASFDYGTYTFIMDVNAWDNGDGMEHRNSTCITLPMEKIGSAEMPTVMDVVAHEFFHSWNVKRIRPRTLEPFDYTKSNMSNELWVAEGFTQYYGTLLLTRAGFRTQDQEIATAGSFMNALLLRPGAKYFTPIQSSQRAVFTDAGVSIDKQNFANTFLSYYTYGGAIAFILDMHLRKDFHKTLDDYMKVLWKDYGKPARWYDVHDLETALASLTSADYAKTFFGEYVYSTRRDDLTPYFAAEGLSLQNDQAGKASWGDITYHNEADGRLTIQRGALMGTPLYEAGLDEGDTILAVDGLAVHQATDIATILAAAPIGKTLSVEYISRGVHGTVRVTLQEARRYSFKADTGDSATAARQAWLGAQ